MTEPGVIERCTTRKRQAKIGEFFPKTDKHLKRTAVVSNAACSSSKKAKLTKTEETETKLQKATNKKFTKVETQTTVEKDQQELKRATTGIEKVQITQAKEEKGNFSKIKPDKDSKGAKDIKGKGKAHTAEEEKPSLKRKTKAAGMSFWSRGADRDTEDYRNGYPGKKDHPSWEDNYLFYTNEIPSKPDGDYIDQIHVNWWGDYKLLEIHHGYIQWLFPIRENGLNWHAQELQLHEIEKLQKSKKAMKRILTSYKMMLDFYGMKLVNEEDGTVERADNWRDRFRHLNKSFHNYLRITRILKCLGEFGYENLKKNFIKFVLHEGLLEGTLENVIDSCFKYWIGVLKDDNERTEMYEYYYELVEDENCAYKRRRLSQWHWNNDSDEEVKGKGAENDVKMSEGNVEGNDVDADVANIKEFEQEFPSDPEDEGLYYAMSLLNDDNEVKEHEVGKVNKKIRKEHEMSESETEDDGSQEMKYWDDKGKESCDTKKSNQDELDQGSELYDEHHEGPKESDFNSLNHGQQIYDTTEKSTLTENCAEANGQVADTDKSGLQTQEDQTDNKPQGDNLGESKGFKENKDENSGVDKDETMLTEFAESKENNAGYRLVNDDNNEEICNDKLEGLDQSVDKGEANFDDQNIGVKSNVGSDDDESKNKELEKGEEESGCEMCKMPTVFNNLGVDGICFDADGKNVALAGKEEIKKSAFETQEKEEITDVGEDMDTNEKSGGETCSTKCDVEAMDLEQNPERNETGPMDI